MKLDKSFVFILFFLCLVDRKERRREREREGERGREIDIERIVNQK